LTLSKDEIQRYSRHLIVPEVGMEGQLKLKGAKVLLVGMRIPPNYGPVYTRRFEAMFAEVARQQNASLVPFMLQGFADKREWFQSDGIHPAAEAQPRILDNIYRRLRALLTTQLA